MATDSQKINDVSYQLLAYEPIHETSLDVDIQNIIMGVQDNTKEVYEQALVNFLVKESKEFDILELNKENKREKLWDALLKILIANPEKSALLADVFTVFRIVSRDKSSVNKLVTDEWIGLVLMHIGLNDRDYGYDEVTLCKIEEAHKVLWNVLFNSREQVEATVTNSLLEKLVNRIKTYDKAPVPDSIKFYDMKIIFLISALSINVRQKLEDELNGFICFLNVLRVILREAAENLAQSDLLPAILDDQKAEISCETLKALFNITLNCSSDDDSLAKYNELVRVLRDYLLASTASIEKTWQLRNDIVNLLTNIPSECYRELLTLVDSSVTVPKVLCFEGLNMIVIYEILMFLKAKFSDETGVSKQLEVYSPVLTVLLKGATTHRPIRKFLRLHILPPLKDVDKRPEETDTLRGYLCKMLTTPITQVRDLVAELLFVLCKCNVSRMIKYTGYGNAAGLFAQRGLLGGRKDNAEADYSSSSEDSETEEYAEQKHLINPVLGCLEQPHEDPMAGMTDEQKEYEAMKLVQLMDSLTRSGAIKPCRVGADGKPHVIEHILELQQGLKIREAADDSDTD
ncbi:synembryn-A [Cylas formicarius]|uniref:synembryn-A n=1 Tax=Cylas formicarius TaxID=197179 RepID=UPI0029589E37|nr:synembryn-A [Cylas formicarius]